MLRESVAQKPTIAVRPGAKARRNSLVVPSLEGAESIGPKPPALHQAQPRRASPVAIRKGADQVSSHLIDSVPWRMNQRFTSQKIAKQRSCPGVIPTRAVAGSRGVRTSFKDGATARASS